MDTLKMIATLTGVEFTEEELYSRKATAVRRMIATVADKIESDNRELARAAEELKRLAAKIETDLTAEPGTRYLPLNAGGEMNGSTLGRLDATIVRRAAYIEQLKMLVLGLDREPSAPEAPAKVRLVPVQPMTIKGFND